MCCGAGVVDKEITFFNWQLAQISLVACVCYLFARAAASAAAAAEINNQF